jgi:hypothetical protein
MALSLIQNASVHETLFCVFPSSSGLVVKPQVCALHGLYPQGLFVTCLVLFLWMCNTMQRIDKVPLYRTLREQVEQIKAGTFNTSSMKPVHLV